MYWKYFKYVIRHKWFVFQEINKMGMPSLLWRALVHDMSKFRPSEFIPYARFFYSGDTSDKIKKDFDKAWLSHLHRNPHHYQYWILNKDDGDIKKLPIPLKYIMEMIGDWRGAGRAITGKDNLHEWFNYNKKQIKNKIEENSFNTVCDLIGESDELKESKTD